MKEKLRRQTPLLPKGAAFILGGLCLAVCLILLMGSFSCDNDEDEELSGGVGFTGDIGVDCLLNCSSEWCKNDDHMGCKSGFCIGPGGDTYCTVVCETDNFCPEGFLCTENCTTQVAKNPMCVREEDYGLLQDLEFCP